MKAGLFAASAVALVQLAAAQPHGQHRHLHQRAPAEVTTTVILPEILVYVDEEGKTLGVETHSPTVTVTSSPASTSAAPSTTSSSSISSAPSVSPVAAYVSSSSSSKPSLSSSSTSTPPASTSTSSSTSAAPSTTKAASSSAASTSSAPASSSSASSGSSGSSKGLSGVKGATYTPYNPDGTCKDSGSVSSDISALAGQGFDTLRIYGVDCNQVANVVPVAKSKGLGVIAGLFNIGSVTSDLGSMSTQLGGDFSGLKAVTVYNEPINNGQLGADAVVSAIKEAKTYLKSTNFAGGVAAVDTFNQLLKDSNKAVIEASDFVAANCHPWFDTTTSPSAAGTFVQNRCVSALTAVAGGKEVVITESGWPCSAPGGGNVASPSAQNTAMAQIKSISGLFAFSYTSTAWHKTPDTVENYWGWNSC